MIANECLKTLNFHYDIQTGVAHQYHYNFSYLVPDKKNGKKSMKILYFWKNVSKLVVKKYFFYEFAKKKNFIVTLRRKFT